MPPLLKCQSYNGDVATALITGYKPEFAFSRDCPLYLASMETVCNCLLPAESAVHNKWLPTETVSVSLLPAKSDKEAKVSQNSLDKKPFVRDGNLSRKHEIVDSLNGSKNWQTGICL